mmetsp:Transcript_24269/g.70030  ORF Transcript_24269/g.70030 Transcript_24269/m.70030 type:complete len:418 (-) Transcript_24269:67-1320(-)
MSELKEMLREAKLPLSGKKADLIARLEKYQPEEEKEEEEEEEEEEEIEEAPAPAPKTQKAAKTAAKKAAKTGAAAFEIGESIEGYYDDDNDWFPAKVLKDLGGGKWTVAWEEDSAEYNLEPGYIRKKISEVDRDGPFLAGEAVEALSDEDEEWYGGIIQTDNGDGTFTLLWDEDGSEYTCKAEAMKKVVPKLELEELSMGQKLRGTVSNIREFGAFVDVGAVRDGLVHVSMMTPVDESAAPFEEGDRVEALYEDEMEWYPATVDKVNKDGTYTLTWDEDGNEPYKAKKQDMKLQMQRMPVKVNDVIDVWVSRVEDGKLGLSMYEGGRKPQRRINLAAFAQMDPNTFVPGTVKKIMNFGLFVEIKAPDGSTAQGLVHVSRIRDGFVEDPWAEAEDGQEVQVRVENVDIDAGRLSLSMK